MFHLNKQDSSGDLEKTKADFKHYFELKSELEDATRQFKETGSSPLNAEQFESKLKEMEALKAEYPILDTGYDPDGKRQIFQDLFTRIFAVILIFITFLFAGNWFVAPSAISKIVMFWDTSKGTYSTADKIALTAKYPIMCWLVLPADREEIDLKLDSSIQNYVNRKLAIDSNYFTWNSDIYLFNPSLKEAHFIYDNNYIGAKLNQMSKEAYLIASRRISVVAVSILICIVIITTFIVLDINYHRVTPCFSCVNLIDGIFLIVLVRARSIIVSGSTSG